MRWFCAFITALLLAINLQAAPAKPGQYCTDLAGVLTEKQRAAVNEQLAQLDRDTGAELLVYIDRSLHGKTIEDFGREAFRSWGVGKKDKNNGMVFFLFTVDRKMRVEVGYGLEGAVPDSVAKQIIAQGVAPKLKKGAEDWNGGVVEAVNQLAAKIRKDGGKPAASPPKPQSDFFGSGSQSSSPSSSATSPSSKGSSSGASSKSSPTAPAAVEARNHLAAGALVGLLVVVVVVVVAALLISERRKARELEEQAARDLEIQRARRRHEEWKIRDNRKSRSAMPVVATTAAVAAAVAAQPISRPKPKPSPNPPPSRRQSSDDDDSSRSRNSWSSDSSCFSSSSSYDSGGGSCGGGGASSDF